jgi:hypothetical protein
VIPKKLAELLFIGRLHSQALGLDYFQMFFVRELVRFIFFIYYFIYPKSAAGI